MLDIMTVHKSNIMKILKILFRGLTFQMVLLCFVLTIIGSFYLGGFLVSLFTANANFITLGNVVFSACTCLALLFTAICELNE